MASTSSEITSSSVKYSMPPSSSQTPPLPWDVFLSFHGPDTRSNFISHLYDKLDGNGIRTFMDNPELRIGEVISDALIKAIKESKTYVVVFSENYASSSWCLDELVEIYNCSLKMDRLVIGVYYKIDPSVVRHQNKSFEKAFITHKIRYADEMWKVNRWRRTLEAIAGFSGQHVSAERDEAHIINEIVDGILLQIKPKTLYVADYPVGLNSRVEDITATLSSGTEKDVIKIGLYGMGGVGKTTLAKALFNQLLRGGSFKGSCFLAEVREASRTAHGLVSLQQQLLDEVLKSKKNVVVHNVEEGIVLIRKRICYTKVLLLIDDIDELKQYQSLVGTFASGSIVIITTRNEEMLDKIKVDPRYRFSVNVLDAAESLSLFTRHAFGNVKPDNILKVFFKDILILADGLPLALEVYGAYLSTRSEVGWKSYIEKLQRNSDSTIQQKLIISLDALEADDEILKKIFLDIACFFIGRDKEEVVNILETYFPHVDDKIDILKKRCLLTINKREELKMHDLLRDMGREVARNQSHDEPGKYSRLWVSKDICKVLKKHKGTEAIEGIIPSNFYYKDVVDGDSFATETFKRMSKLRFLYLKNVNLNGSFEQTFESLRWLRWDCCPLERLPSDFCPQELVILTLRSSRMRTMWELNMDSQVFKKLKTLDMSYSLDLTVTPDFTKLPRLKTLNLMGCKSLEEVHISIGSLVGLVSLNLGGCVNLRSLPDSLCNLRALKSLNIGGCSSLEALPKELGNIESLKELNAWGLTVPKLPDSIIRLSKLDKLNLSDNVYLETPSSSASYSTPTRWDVFLSFSGNGTQYSFIHNLYNSLHYYHVQTYMDEPDRRTGEGISDELKLQVIKESKAYIVVLSQYYASSRWCLDQLVEILDCCKKFGRLVIPVFYYIDPSVVRYQTGILTEAFEKLQSGFAGEMKKVNEWRLTLTALSNFSGYHISDISVTRLEYDTIIEVIDRVLLEKNPQTLDVAEYPVRLGYRVKGITTLLSTSGTKGVIRFGIYGMGGVGKTTLAKALYNQLLRTGNFKHSCFLANIREVSGTFKGLESLQQQLINDVLKITKKVEVENVDHGTRVIRAQICSTKVLVVIDDLDDHKQFESLVGPFASGSVVIITTRDQEILDKIEVETKYRYKVNELDDVESLALFTRHAFGNAKPNNSFMVLSKCILRHAGGLPLALEAFGSYLYRQSEVRWESFIEKLQWTPYYRIQEKLVISFDALKLVNRVLQDIFLDIACFFIGRKKEEVFQIMKTYYPNLDHNIDILKKRCLLTINSSEELGMHDLLQDMGREIVRNNSPDEPGKRSRLWVTKDICNMLKKHKGTDAIEGIVFTYQDALEGLSFTAETFRMMSKLRFLHLKGVNLTGSFEQTFKDLRWLCWDYCPLKCLPSEFYPQKIVILELPHSKIRTMWELNMVSHVFEKLKTLNMKYSQDLTTTPDFTKLPCLESLNLEGCESLEELHISIGSLVKLVSLNLQGCVKLRGLPNTICNLESLEVLSINGCSSLEALPIELGAIESLKELNAKALTVPKLPDSIGCLSKLVELRLGYNENLESLPDTICNLRSLVNLDLRDCSHLLAIAELPSNLKWIRADGCKTMKRLPNLCNLKQLEVLYLKDCSGLKEIEGLEELTSLRELHLGGCNASLLAYTLTKHLFQIYSGFGHQIKIYIPAAAEFLDWISQSADWNGQSSNLGSTICFNLRKNVSHNFLAMILCFKHLGVSTSGETIYSVKNTTSGFIWSGSLDSIYHEAQIIIVPRSIFSVKHGDNRIELTANTEIIGIHLLYKTAITIKWLKHLCKCLYQKDG